MAEEKDRTTRYEAIWIRVKVYIPFLQELIGFYQHQNRQQQLEKITKIYDLLTNQRLNYRSLCKCEKVLIKLYETNPLKTAADSEPTIKRESDGDTPASPSDPYTFASPSDPDSQPGTDELLDRGTHVQSDNPTEPDSPAEPSTSAKSGCPVVPDSPAEPDTLAEPETPAEPYTLVESDTPAEPDDLADSDSILEPLSADTDSDELWDDPQPKKSRSITSKPSCEESHQMRSQNATYSPMYPSQTFASQWQYFSGADWDAKNDVFGNFPHPVNFSNRNFSGRNSNNIEPIRRPQLPPLYRRRDSYSCFPSIKANDPRLNRSNGITAPLAPVPNELPKCVVPNPNLPLDFPRKDPPKRRRSICANQVIIEEITPETVLLPPRSFPARRQSTRGDFNVNWNYEPSSVMLPPRSFPARRQSICDDSYVNRSNEPCHGTSRVMLPPRSFPHRRQSVCSDFDVNRNNDPFHGTLSQPVAFSTPPIPRMMPPPLLPMPPMLAQPIPTSVPSHRSQPVPPLQPIPSLITPHYIDAPSVAESDPRPAEVEYMKSQNNYQHPTNRVERPKPGSSKAPLTYLEYLRQKEMSKIHRGEKKQTEEIDIPIGMVPNKTRVAAKEYAKPIVKSIKPKERRFTPAVKGKPSTSQKTDRKRAVPEKDKTKPVANIKDLFGQQLSRCNKLYRSGDASPAVGIDGFKIPKIKQFEKPGESTVNPVEEAQQMNQRKSKSPEFPKSIDDDEDMWDSESIEKPVDAKQQEKKIPKDKNTSLKSLEDDDLWDPITSFTTNEPEHVAPVVDDTISTATGPSTSKEIAEGEDKRKKPTFEKPKHVFQPSSSPAPRRILHRRTSVAEKIEKKFPSSKKEATVETETKADVAVRPRRTRKRWAIIEDDDEDECGADSHAETKEKRISETDDSKAQETAEGTMISVKDISCDNVVSSTTGDATVMKSKRDRKKNEFNEGDASSDTRHDQSTDPGLPMETSSSADNHAVQGIQSSEAAKEAQAERENRETVAGLLRGSENPDNRAQLLALLSQMVDDTKLKKIQEIIDSSSDKCIANEKEKQPVETTAPPEKLASSRKSSSVPFASVEIVKDLKKGMEIALTEKVRLKHVRVLVQKVDLFKVESLANRKGKKTAEKSVIMDKNGDARPLSTSIDKGPMLKRCKFSEDKLGTKEEPINLKPWLETPTVKNRAHSLNMLEHKSLFCFYKCMGTSCCFTTTIEAQMEKHIDNHELVGDIAGAGSPKSWLECAYCDVVAEGNIDLLNHLILVHTGSAFQCAYCFYRSRETYHVVLHQKLHHAKKKTAVLVNKSDKQPLTPADHRRLNRRLIDNIRPLICTVCYAKYYVLDSYMSHLQYDHAEVTTIMCQCCKKHVPKVEIPQHLLQHNIGIYECLYCQFGSRNLDAVRIHVCNHHPHEPLYCCIRYSMTPGKGKEASLKPLEKSVDENALIYCSFKPEELNYKSPDTKSNHDINFTAKPGVITNRVGGNTNIFTSAQSPSSSSMETSNQSVGVAAKTAQVIKMPMISSVSGGVSLPGTSTMPIITTVQGNYRGPAPTEPSASLVMPKIGGVNVCGMPIITRVEGGVADMARWKPSSSLLQAPKEDEVTMLTAERIAMEMIKDTGLSKNVIYRCVFKGCYSVLPDGTGLRKHLSFCHLPADRYICSHCKGKPWFHTVMSFTQHLKKHETQRIFCFMCDYKGSFALEVMKHVKVVHNISKPTMLFLNPKKADPNNDIILFAPRIPTEAEWKAYYRKLIDLYNFKLQAPQGIDVL